MADNQHPIYLAYLAADLAERSALAEVLRAADAGDQDAYADAQIDWQAARSATWRALEAWRAVTEAPEEPQ
jgi:hypothetical protein